MKNEIDLTKLTKDEIERDFVTRGKLAFEVLKTNRNGGYPIVICIENHSIHCLSALGKRIGSDINSDFDLIPRPVETFERDEKVMVSGSGDFWNRRHYCEFKNGRHWCYTGGQSSWSSDCGAVSFDKVRKPTPEELAK